MKLASYAPDALEPFLRPTSLALEFVALYLLYAIGRAVYNLYFHPLSKFPGPRLRNAFYFLDMRDEFSGLRESKTREMHDRYGDIVRINPDSLSFRTGRAWRDIYGTRQGKGQIPKDPQFYVRLPNESIDIIVAKDAEHSRMRRVLAHAFSDSALREQEPLMNQYFDLLIERLHTQINGSAKGKVDLVKWYNCTTFDIIGDLAFGEPFHALEQGDYHSYMSNILGSLKSVGFLRAAQIYPIVMVVVVLSMSLFKDSGNLLKERNKQLQFAREKTETRLSTKTDRKDFISYILRHNDERGMSKAEIVQNSNLLIFAGSETTATLLSGATFYLLKNPSTLKKLVDEIRTAFATAEDITLTSTGQLKYLHAVLEESLRMYPPVPSRLPRRVAGEGDVIDGHFVPPNTSVGVHQWSAYRSEKNFHNPTMFVPERWLSDPPEEYKHDDKTAFQPFSTGPRNCIGKNLAYSEMRVIVARMLWNFDLELCEESTRWADQKSYLLWEKRPLMVNLTNRKMERA